MIKSFHFYYLSQDQGLIYDYPSSDYRLCLLEPWRQHMRAQGVEIQTGRPVESVELEPEGISVDGDVFDRLILATDVVGTRAILAASPALQVALPETWAQVRELRPSGRFAVARLWLKGKLEETLVPFVITERRRVLDAIALNSDVGGSAMAWAEAHQGTVLELHCYHMPDDVKDDEVLDLMVNEFGRSCRPPLALSAFTLICGVNANFTAFHTGMYGPR